MSQESSSVPTVVMGSLKLLGLPDTQCFKSFTEIWKAIEDNFAVILPTSITNVVVSNIQPLDTQRDAVWFRLSNGGTFIGIYMFSDGAWRQVFPVPQTVYTVYGDSRNPPAGYILTDDSGALTLAQRTHLKAEWLQDPSLLFYSIFTVVSAPI